MRWIWWWIFVRNAVKSGELFFFTAFTAITAFLTKIHRIHRISYENLPKNLDPGRNGCLANTSVGIPHSDTLSCKILFQNVASFGKITKKKQKWPFLWESYDTTVLFARSCKINFYLRKKEAINTAGSWFMISNSVWSHFFHQCKSLQPI